MQQTAMVRMNIGTMTTARRNAPMTPAAIPISTCDRLGTAYRRNVMLTIIMLPYAYTHAYNIWTVASNYIVYSKTSIMTPLRTFLQLFMKMSLSGRISAYYMHNT